MTADRPATEPYVAYPNDPGKQEAWQHGREEGIRRCNQRHRLARFRQEVEAALDVLDGALDATHPEGHGCDVCRAADELRTIVEEQGDE